MPNLNQIVCLINDSIKTGAFSKSPFDTAKFYNIARNRPNTDKNGWVMPMVIGDDDNGTFVNPDDLYPLVLYHRIENPEYADSKADFGNAGTFIDSTYPMRLVCFGDRGKLKRHQEDVLDVIIYHFPREFTNAQLQPLGITNCVIDTGSVDNDNMTVWGNEFKDIEFDLNNNQFMFSIKYTVKMTYKCFDLC